LIALPHAGTARVGRTTKDDRSADELAQLVADLPPLLTIEETARVLRISRRTLAKVLAAKRIRTIRPTCSGGRVLIPRTALHAFLTENLD